MGVAVGLGTGVGVAVGLGVAVGVGVALGVALGVAVGVAVGLGTGVGVALGLGVDVGEGVALGVALGVGEGVDVGVGVGVGAAFSVIAVPLKTSFGVTGGAPLNVNPIWIEALGAIVAVQLAGVSVYTLATGPVMFAFQTEVSCWGVVIFALQLGIVVLLVFVMFR